MSVKCSNRLPRQLPSKPSSLVPRKDVFLDMRDADHVYDRSTRGGWQLASTKMPRSLGGGRKKGELAVATTSEGLWEMELIEIS